MQYISQAFADVRLTRHGCAPSQRSADQTDHHTTGSQHLHHLMQSILCLLALDNHNMNILQNWVLSSSKNATKKWRSSTSADSVSDLFRVLSLLRACSYSTFKCNWLAEWVLLRQWVVWVCVVLPLKQYLYTIYNIKSYC